MCEVGKHTGNIVQMSEGWYMCSQCEETWSTKEAYIQSLNAAARLNKKNTDARNRTFKCDVCHKKHKIPDDIQNVMQLLGIDSL